MADSLFDQLQAAAVKKNLNMRSRAARNWFRGQVSRLGNLSPSKVLADKGLKKVGDVGVGHMHMFVYDPKTKDKLPYYDTFPLVLVVEPAPGGFYGLNLHYLAPGVRAAFLDKLMSTVNNDKMDDTTKMKLSYNLLKSASTMSDFKPCFKRYLATHIQSRIVKIDARDWPIAIFLPVERFVGKSKRSVWRDSRENY